MNLHPKVKCWALSDKRLDDFTYVDPEFDNYDGLILAQIRNPLPIYETEDYPGQHRNRRRARLYQDIRAKQHRLEWQVEQLHKAEYAHLQRARLHLNTLAHHLKRFSPPKPPTPIDTLQHWRHKHSSNQFAIFTGPSPQCRCCMPYNGSHTPDYWGTGQKDPW